MNERDERIERKSSREAKGKGDNQRDGIENTNRKRARGGEGGNGMKGKEECGGSLEMFVIKLKKG